MNVQDHIANDARIAVMAEQEVIGALLLDNDAIDRIPDLSPEHFYRADHSAIFAEIRRQLGMGQNVDVLTLYEPLSGQVENCLQYLGTMRSMSGSAVVIRRHADTVLDKFMKRKMADIGRTLEAESMNGAVKAMDLLADTASKLDDLMSRKTSSDPQWIGHRMARYADVLERRMSGADRPISTGLIDFDKGMRGGFRRGTLSVVAARPGMGKTAFGLTVARGVTQHGGVALFLSMEMDADEVDDRNTSALGRIPLDWLMNPPEHCRPGSEDDRYMQALTAAAVQAQNMQMHIDDQTGLNMLAIRSKARKVKRTAGGLDVIVVDQLSFLTGAQSEKSYEQVGEYTRGLIALAKELKCAVILLCQLNRNCEQRPDKRPMASDLAQSGSIEQDASNIIMLYRDEIYNPDTQEKGVCELIRVKQRQGQPGVTAMAYIAEQTRFENLSYGWTRSAPPDRREGERRRGFSS